MSERFMEMVNRAPVTFGVLGLYVLLAFLTDPLNPKGGDLITYGAGVPLLVMDGQVWRLVSHCFLHGGLLHLALNTYALFILGPFLEQRLGSLRFAILYLMAGVSGGIAGMLWHQPLTLLVGGSGALFGMLGAILASNMRSGRHVLDFLSYPGTRMLLICLVVNLALGFFLPMVSNSAHIGGLIGGTVVMYCFLDLGRFTPDRTSRFIRSGWIAVFAALLFYVVFPVLRWDYHLKMSFYASGAEQRAEHKMLVDLYVAEGRDGVIEVMGTGPPVYNEIAERWQRGR